LLRTAPMCVADGLNNYLDTPILKTALAAPALWGTYTGPWSPGSHGNLLFWEGRRGRSVVGGAAALVKALESAARGAGVEIATSSAVEEILVEGSVVRGVKVRQGSERLEVFHARTVDSACDAKGALLNL